MPRTKGRTAHHMDGTVRPGDRDFNAGLVRLRPTLQAFALRLCANVHLAEDLVQETILKALLHRRSFTMGTNQRAWLFTILRNTFLSDRRRAGRETTCEGDIEPPSDLAMNYQEAAVTIREVASAIDNLPAGQKQAIMLVGCEGLSYEETAQLCGCAVGTVKSRVNRARRKLGQEHSRDA